MPLDSNRNLLFGILALQMDFISREQLVAATSKWLTNKTSPIEEILLEQKALSEEDRQLLAPLVARHIDNHDGDPQKSLAALSAIGSVGEDLQSLDDPQLEATLSIISRDRRDLQIAEIIPSGDQGAQTLVVGASGSHASRFRILRPHAKGGLGEVSVAEDTELKREVALKEIQPQFADDPNSRARFLLEAEVTGGLEHPGIVPVYGLGQYADGRPYYAMRFIRGDSLQEAADRFHGKAGTLGQSKTKDNDLASEAQTKYYSIAFRKLLGRFVDVCNAIEYAHSRGVLHRDLKPGNIMLGKYGETLVVDWGLAKPHGCDQDAKIYDESTLTPSSGSGSAPTQMGSAIGTPAYMPPEQAAGKLGELGPASDVYSLGATLYSLLTGQPPLTDTDVGALLRKVQRGEFPPPCEVKSWVPRALEAICLKAMALQPEARYSSPGALAEDVEEWLADQPVTAYREPWNTRARRFVKRHRTAVTGALASAGVALIGLVVLTAVTSASNRRLANANRQINAQYGEITRKNQTLDAKNTELLAANEKEQAARAAAEKAREQAEQVSAALREANSRINNLNSHIIQQNQSLDSKNAELLAANEKEQAARAAAEKARDQAEQATDRLADANTKLASANQELRLANERERAAKLQADANANRADQQRAVAFRTLLDLSDSYEAFGNNCESFGRNDMALIYYRKGLNASESLVNSDPDNVPALGRTASLYSKLGDVNLKLVGLGKSAISQEARLKAGMVVALSKLVTWPEAVAPGSGTLKIGIIGNDPFQAGDINYLDLRIAGQKTVVERFARADDYQPCHILVVSRSADIRSAILKTKGTHVLLVAETPGQAQQGAAVNLVVDFELNRISMEVNVDAIKDEGLMINPDLLRSPLLTIVRQHDVFGGLRLPLDRIIEALEYYQQALEIRQQLTTSDAGKAKAPMETKISYMKLRDVSQQLRRTDYASGWLQKALEINDKLAVEKSGDAEVSGQSLFSRKKLGAVSPQLGQSGEVLKYYQKLLQIRQQLAAARPDDAQAQRDLMISYVNLALVKQARFQYSEAATHFKEALATLNGIVELPSEHHLSAVVADLKHRADFCLQADSAVGDLQFALTAPRKEVPRLLRLRCAALTYFRNLDEAAESAGKLREFDPKDPDTLYQACGSYAQIAAAVGIGKSQRSADEQAARQKYLALSLTALREAVAAGYRDFEQMQTDPDLASIRSFPEFDKLIESGKQHTDEAKPATESQPN